MFFSLSDLFLEGAISRPVKYVLVALIVIAAAAISGAIGRRAGRRAIAQRLTSLGNRLGLDPPEDDSTIEGALAYLEAVTGAATEAVQNSSSDAIRLRRSFDTLPQGVVICDETGAVIYRNEWATQLMTSRHGDALAAQAVVELLETAWSDGAAERTLDLYGPPRRTLIVKAQVVDDGRRPVGVMGLIEDISEKRRLEEVRRDFVANVSHELKTPVGALGLLAETLVVEPDGDVARRLASRIQTEAFRVSRIIDDLLDLSRIEAEEAPPREPVLINLVMAEAIERVRAAAEQRRIAIELIEPNPPAAVVGDRRQLVSAMHALIENAITYSYDGETVTVAGSIVAGPGVSDEWTPEEALGAFEPPTEPVFASRSLAASSTASQIAADFPTAATATVRITVTDRGVGIPARDLDRIFERFYRVDYGRSRETGGTGLGLSIVRHVAANHQGWVEVESREGEGSTFTLVLPLHTGRAG